MDGTCSIHEGKMWSENRKGRDHLEDPDLGWDIRIFRNRMRRCGLDSPGSEQGPVAGSCEQGNKPLGSIKGREFLKKMSGC